MTLHNAQDAIREAIEGGWEPQPADPLDCQWNNDHYFVDPLFWKSLGKARGWKGYDSDAYCDNCNDFVANDDKWRYFAHKWLQTRLSNGDENKFWTSLP